MRLPASRILACTLLLGSASAQLTGVTIMELLNSTKISPASKFVKLLSSSPDYQPIIDLLSKPGNLTVFAPSDKVFDGLSQEFPGIFSSEGNSSDSSSASTSASASESALTTSGAPTSQASSAPVQSQASENPQASAQGPEATPGEFGPIHNNVDQVPDNDPSVAQPESILPMISPGLKTYSLPDIIYYHIVNGVHTTESITNNSIVTTLLTNQTIDKTGNGMPLILGSDKNDYWAGNGLGQANISVSNILTSNGVIHIVDKLLVPPSSPSDIAGYVSDLSFVNLYLMKNASFAQEINNATNITVFAPVNQALLALDFSNMTMDQLSSMVATHIVSGTYYSSNLTQTDQSTNATDTTAGNTTSIATSTDTINTSSPTPIQTSAEGLTPSNSMPASNPTNVASSPDGTNSNDPENPQNSGSGSGNTDYNEELGKISGEKSSLVDNIDSPFSFDEDWEDLSIQMADDGASYVLTSDKVGEVNAEMGPDGSTTATTTGDTQGTTGTGDNSTMTGTNTTTPATNGTSSSGKTLTSLSGTPLQIQAVNETSFTVNGIPVVHSEILMNNGVLYLIGGVLQPNTPTAPEGNQTTDGGAGGTPTADGTDSSPTATEAGLGSDQNRSGSNILTQSILGGVLTALSVLITFVL
ncbi:hypothetical protein J3Q64DRAFT_1826230 [Phycomyces blakesleeanus]|uniref:FAS1 domain-containing protein n=1 Tax=Phycomyces blakesleeanus TaxID=4837 RepID=A0ABR3AI14_PHYBL